MGECNKLLVSLWVLATTCAASRAVGRFGIVTDVHYANVSAAGTRHYRDSLPKMRDAVASFRASDPPLDFVVELGDLKDKSPDNDVDATIGFLDSIEAVLSSTGLPTYHVLGNHDVDILDQPTVTAHAVGQPTSAQQSGPGGAYSFDVPAGGHANEQADNAGCLVAQAAGANGGVAPYVWVVHNDSTRNWLSSAPAACHAKALAVPDVTIYGKRHGGQGAYSLNATQSAGCCSLLAGCAAAPAPYVPPATSTAPLHFVVLNGDFNANAVPWAAIDLNGTQFQWNQPWVPSTQLQWVAADLAQAAARGQKAVVFVHYRIDGGPGMNQSAWVDECTLDNALVLRDVLAAAGNVLATFSGHDHAPKPPFTVGDRNMLMFTHSAMVEGPYPGNNAYSIVTLYDNCTVEVKGYGNATTHVHQGQPGCTIGN